MATEFNQTTLAAVLKERYAKGLDRLIGLSVQNRVAHGRLAGFCGWHGQPEGRVRARG